MYLGKKILILIPARGGSKGIPQKNIKLLNGKPLISYTIDFAKKIDIADAIVVNSDSDAILACAAGDNITLLKRLDALGQDTTKMSEVIQFTADFFDNKYDFIVLLQPTSPLRSLKSSLFAIKTFIEKAEEYDSLMPLYPQSPKLGTIMNNYYSPNYAGEQRRQDLPKIFEECGTLFIYKKEMIHTPSIKGERIFPYIVKNRVEALDIDTMEDFQIADFLIQSNLSLDELTTSYIPSDLSDDSLK